MNWGGGEIREGCCGGRGRGRGNGENKIPYGDY